MSRNSWLMVFVIAGLAALQLQCTTTAPPVENTIAPKAEAANAQCELGGPCVVGPDTAAPGQTSAIGSKRKAPKRIWAQSYLFADAPKIEVKEWLGAKPGAMDGKFVVVEFWRTWCSACKRTTPLMNMIHEKYSDDFVVIGITGEEKEKVMAGWDGPKMKYPIALDKVGPNAEKPEQGALEAKFGVWGWPHVVILEPQHRAVIWEGFPGLKGYELTEEKIKRMIAIKNGNKR